MSRRDPMRLRTLITALGVSVLAVAAPSALAERGGNGGGGTGTTASVVASPNPAAPDGTRVYLSGCGYEFKVAHVKIRHSAGYTEGYTFGMWSTGCLASGYFLTREAGTYSIDVYQSHRNPRKPHVLKASTTLTVG
jgi:hypothetical protein